MIPQAASVEVGYGSFASIKTAAGNFRLSPDSRHTGEQWNLSLWASC
jgi:hypothetical protein